MSLALVAMSHSPLLDYVEPSRQVAEAVRDAFARARTFVTDYGPDLVVTFGPDHFNGFFYDLMPPFCVCLDAVGIGDYDSFEGPLNVRTDIAEQLAQAVLNSDVDIAISRRAELDHGAVQPLEILFADAGVVPVVPIYVNGLADPFTPVRRVRKMGEAIGRYLRDLDERVLLIASGGLSHDPPVPRWAQATEDQRRFLLDGRKPTPEARAARQENTIRTARAFAAGEATIQELNPAWDRAFMGLLASGDLERMDEYEPAEMTEAAGHSVHEVRTWMAAFAALQQGGEYRVTNEFYRPIKEYIAGFGMMTAITA